MSYRHSVYEETEANRRLGDLAAEAGAALAPIHGYTPLVCFFREDPAGRFERPIRVSGFIDHVVGEGRFEIFVRGDRSPSETVRTIFHEAVHIRQFQRGEMRTMTSDEREAAAKQFAERFAPIGHWSSTYKSIYSELACGMIKMCIRDSNFERGRQFQHALIKIDREAALQLNDLLRTPKERLTVIKREAEQERRAAESDVRLAEARRSLERFNADCKRRLEGL